jgi:hypothetical protein
LSSNHVRRARGNKHAQARPSSRNAADNGANWQRLRAQYLDRARAAIDAGDRIAAEGYYQHAEHYSRMIAGTAV